MKSEEMNDLPVKFFTTQAELREWLESNHALSVGIWLKMFKKGSGIASVIYPEALDEALCFGWIDGQRRAGDASYFLQRFTPRRTLSTWSKVNIGHVGRLEKAGKIMSSGWKAIEQARADGRWDNAYDSQSNMKIPDLLLGELTKEPKRLAFYESLNKANKYAILWRIQSAKNPQIRERRMNNILEMLDREETIHPQRNKM
jgi:uncharacterized protein YdeI (YjbR/CyaY-like superfamily)